MEKLLDEAREKCSPSHVEVTYEYLYELVKRFRLVVLHVERLLECIEFNPLEFFQMIDEAEQQARQEAIKDVPKYILSKLGIGKDPFEKFNNKSGMLSKNSCVCTLICV